MGNRIPYFHLKPGSGHPGPSFCSHVVPEGESQRKRFQIQPRDPRNGDRRVWKRLRDPGWKNWGIPFFFGMFRTLHTRIKEGVYPQIHGFFSWSRGREALGSGIKYGSFPFGMFAHPTEFPACFPSPSCWNCSVCGTIRTSTPSRIPASSKSKDGVKAGSRPGCCSSTSGGANRGLRPFPNIIPSRRGWEGRE